MHVILRGLELFFDGTFNNITVISWCLTLREIRFKCLNIKKKVEG
jgi:hypothetical protein